MFSANFAFDKATNGQIDIKHEMWSTLSKINVFSIVLAITVAVPRLSEVWGALLSCVCARAAGLMRQMTFRKDDGSFGTWPHADSSTW